MKSSRVLGSVASVPLGSSVTLLVRFAVLPDTSHLLQNRLCDHGSALGS